MELKVSQETVDRLRKSIAEAVEADRAGGFEAGAEWATNDASARELRILEDGGDIARVAGEDGIEAFWEAVLGDTWSSQVTEDFASGFEDSAKAVWAEVQRRF